MVKKNQKRTPHRRWEGVHAKNSCLNRQKQRSGEDIALQNHSSIDKPALPVTETELNPCTKSVLSFLSSVIIDGGLTLDFTM